MLFRSDFNSITDFGVFWKTARKLGLTVRVKSDDGKGYKRRHKADLVEDYRQQLAELQRSSVSACGFQTQVDVHDSADAEVSVMSADDLTSITDPGLFRKTARKLGLTVRFKPGHGKHFNPRRKADIVEDYRRQLGESQCGSGSVYGFQMQVSKQVLLRDKIRRIFRGGGSPTLVDSIAAQLP